MMGVRALCNTSDEDSVVGLQCSCVLVGCMLDVSCNASECVSVG